MAEKVGIKETKEAILAITILGAFVAERAKDGFKLDDLTALVSKFVLDADFKAKLEAGVNGLDKVGGELKDLDIAEIVELLTIVPELLKLLEGFKK